MSRIKTIKIMLEDGSEQEISVNYQEPEVAVEPAPEAIPPQDNEHVAEGAEQFPEPAIEPAAVPE